MPLRTFLRYDFPDWWTDNDIRQYLITSDWDCHDREYTCRDMYFKNLAEDWLAGVDEIDCANGRREYVALEPIPFQPKPSKDIRAEKTRDYRKRRPAKQRYAPAVLPHVAAVLCLLGVKP